MSEEEPGKILHEVRLGVSSGPSLGGKPEYHGSVDATPLFVSVLGVVSRWGFAKETIAALLPNEDRALDWVRDYGDRDGDGFVEYGRLNDRGLVNQGWKDSWDGISFADGTWRNRRSPCARSKPTCSQRTRPVGGWPSPQAWSATAPILLVTGLMRYDAHVSRGGLWLDPVLTEAYGDLHIPNAPMAGGRITIDISGSTTYVQGPTALWPTRHVTSCSPQAGRWAAATGPCRRGPLDKGYGLMSSARRELPGPIEFPPCGWCLWCGFVPVSPGGPCWGRRSGRRR